MERNRVASFALIAGCRMWDRLTDKLRLVKTPEDRNFYISVDFENLNCVIDGNSAEVRVGSAVGHKAHIEIGDDIGMVHYYDSDRPVNTVMYKIFTDIGLDCKLEENEGVFCRGVRDDNVRDVFKALAMATSMDIRLDWCKTLSGLTREECMAREFNFYKRNVAVV
ncbi:MAG: hypothetical protein NZ932_03790 [Candidatus Bathyarchaeota archaeon]|nr:hypothetical protein [Candidatus Bathyarchaeota archaeon]MDW8022410.1 hypothetical protein [Nitrososphaerota archaeon]